MTKTYKAIEDNAGGLHLFVFDDDRCIYATRGFERDSPGSLTDCLNSLEEGADPAQWDGGDEDPASSWAEHEAQEERWPHGYKTVADQDGRYSDRMGVAAKREFGFTTLGAMEAESEDGFKNPTA